MNERKNLLKKHIEILKHQKQVLQKSIDRLDFKVRLYESGEIKQHKGYYDDYNLHEDNSDDYKNNPL